MSTHETVRWGDVFDVAEWNDSLPLKSNTHFCKLGGKVSELNHELWFLCLLWSVFYICAHNLLLPTRANVCHPLFRSSPCALRFAPNYRNYSTTSFTQANKNDARACGAGSGEGSAAGDGSTKAFASTTR